VRAGAGAFAVLGGFFAKKGGGNPCNEREKQARGSAGGLDEAGGGAGRVPGIPVFGGRARARAVRSGRKAAGRDWKRGEHHAGRLRQAAGSRALDEPGAGPGRGGPASILRGFGKL